MSPNNELEYAAMTNPPQKLFRELLQTYKGHTCCSLVSSRIPVPLYLVYPFITRTNQLQPLSIYCTVPPRDATSLCITTQRTLSGRFTFARFTAHLHQRSSPREFEMPLHRESRIREKIFLHAGQHS